MQRTQNKGYLAPAVPIAQLPTHNSPHFILWRKKFLEASISRFAQFSHLGLPIPMAFLLIIVRSFNYFVFNQICNITSSRCFKSFQQHDTKVRVFIQRQIFKPLGISLGLKALEPKSSRSLRFFNLKGKVT